jgi:hypothetical protein
MQRWTCLPSQPSCQIGGSVLRNADRIYRGDRPVGSSRGVSVNRVFRRVVYEAVLVVVGAIGAVLVALVVHSVAGAVVLGVLSALVALAALGVRYEISDRLESFDRVARVIASVRTPRWWTDAGHEVDASVERYKSWSAGSRRVAEGESLLYQVRSLQGARGNVRAVHLVDEPKSLQMWADPQKSFASLVAAYRELPERVTVRRIMVLDADDWELLETDGRKLIQDALLDDVCRTQLKPRSVGLGADLRLLWRSGSKRTLSDFLIVDDKEVCSIERLGHGKFGDLDVSIHPAHVEASLRMFESAWVQAIRAGDFLPPA